MADSKLSALTAATDLTSAEFYVAQSGASKRAPVALLTKSVVGLGNVDNTSDANKPVSTATQTALDAKAPTASPTFTGPVTSSGAVVSPGTTMSGVQINVALRDNLYSATGDVTWTHCATPAVGQEYGVIVTTDGTARTIGLPVTAFSGNRGGDITDITFPASSTHKVLVRRTSSGYLIFGDPVTAAQAKAGLAIASTDISDFNSATRAQVEAELVAGSNITITPGSSGTTRTLTIASTGGGGSGGSITLDDGTAATDPAGSETFDDGTAATD